jgi:hypothetical protein
MCIKEEIKRINRSKEWRLGVDSAYCSKLDYIHDMLPKAWFPPTNTKERRIQQLTMEGRMAKPVLRNNSLACWVEKGDMYRRRRFHGSKYEAAETGANQE